MPRRPPQPGVPRRGLRRLRLGHQASRQLPVPSPPSPRRPTTTAAATAQWRAMVGAAPPRRPRRRSTRACAGQPPSMGAPRYLNLIFTVSTGPFLLIQLALSMVIICSCCDDKKEVFLGREDLEGILDPEEQGWSLHVHLLKGFGDYRYRRSPVLEPPHHRRVKVLPSC
ncbi:hypothetical protein D1007_45173 [Hordeum vulgare]|nr:hypothetical protein D1007_45173 [Hordeum vulgare]